MKRSTMTVGWGDLLKDCEAPVMPKGYSSTQTIARRLGVSVRNVHARLKKARLAGKIQAIQGRNHQGQLTWFYKD